MRMYILQKTKPKINKKKIEVYYYHYRALYQVNQLNLYGINKRQKTEKYTTCILLAYTIN